MPGPSLSSVGIRARSPTILRSHTIARRPRLALPCTYNVRPFSWSPHRKRPTLPFLLSTAVLSNSPDDPTSLFTPLSQLLLDHPIHSFGLTIILVTLFLRTTISLPAVFWQRNRLKKARQIVEPEMRRLNKDLAPRLAIECRRRGMNYEAYYGELKAQVGLSPFRSVTRLEFG